MEYQGRRGTRGFRRGLRRFPRYRARFAPRRGIETAANHVKVETLEPEQRGLDLLCKVLTEPKLDLPTRCYLLSVGDETGCVDLLLSNTYYNNLVQVLKPGVSLEVRNGFVVMREEKFMALRTAQGGLVSLPQQELQFAPNTNQNVSAAEYELSS